MLCPSKQGQNKSPVIGVEFECFDKLRPRNESGPEQVIAAGRLANGGCHDPGPFACVKYHFDKYGYILIVDHGPDFRLRLFPVCVRNEFVGILKARYNHGMEFLFQFLDFFVGKRGFQREDRSRNFRPLESRKLQPARLYFFLLSSCRIARLCVTTASF